MWALPSMPFMYFVGATELLSGLGLFGYVFGIAPQLIAQWAAVVPPSIMIAASTSHVLNGDPPGTSGFAAALAGLFIINNFAMAFYFAGSKAKAA
ncbi:hypothetical protein CTAYLR_003900 [Chrysophaeum taylorii]|uniref:Uncharacterized protein n=1 Tax=Chrysophaeum taylorii TaxID=2483200 RepID=A0AAD7XSU2_9STRA|nr:hypothetical protein CTAYLR_003900 [Chrysophaeum taylorii]